MPCVALLGLGGCAQQRTLVEAFPPRDSPRPWVMAGSVWTGTFEQAASGFGDEAEAWALYEPQRVWLATYTHERRPGKKLIARIASFETPREAQRAFENLLPLEAKPLDAGDSACWTASGVMVRWQRLLLDVFGSDPADTATPEQAAFLFGLIEHRMPAGLPESPR